MTYPRGVVTVTNYTGRDELVETIRAYDIVTGRTSDLAPELLRAHGNKCGPAKAVAAELAARTTGLALRRIGEYYGLTPSGVSSLRRRLLGNSEITGTVEELVAALEKA